MSRVSDFLVCGGGRKESYGPPKVDGIGFGVDYNEIPIYPIFHLLGRTIHSRRC